MPRNEKHYFICQFCGEEFYKPRKAFRNPQFCNQKCHYAFRKTKRIKKTCKYCRVAFEVPKGQKDRQYCSRECRNKGIIDLSKKNIFTCEWCNKEFENWTSRPNRFCSAQCRSKFGAKQLKPREISGKVQLVCKICNKSYITTRFFVEHRNSSFCSKECQYKDRSKKMTGGNNPNWKGGFNPNDYGANWSSQSRKARKRDDYTCQICSYRSRIRNLDVHHIKPLITFKGNYKSANQTNNLVCLCRKCHKKVENGKIPCPKPMEF